MAKASLREAQAVLREVFRYPDFRPGQDAAIEAAVSGRDTVVLLPTGRGKSLCYQVPALVAARRGAGTTLVISPLIALINDQVQALEGRGVAAAALHSHLDAAAQREVLRSFADGELEFLYVSPERAASPSFRRRLAEVDIALLAIDEAHCVSQWGHDFRPDYMRLHELRPLTGAPIIALTATATPLVMDEIVKHLELDRPAMVRGDFQRPNLAFGVLHIAKKARRLDAAAGLLQDAGFRGRGGQGRAIIYCSTRKTAEDVAKELKARGFAAGWYHAGRTQLARERAHRAFEGGRTKILVATNAYGMGIDFPDVRLIIHFQAPGSLEAYYQEAGRAGRDGLPARCVLFFGASDLVTQRRLGRSGSRSVELEGRRDAALEAVQDYATTQGCRQARLCEHFSGTPEAHRCEQCDGCTGESPATEFDESHEDAVAPELTELSETQLSSIVAAMDRLSRPVGRRDFARALRGSKAKSLSRGGLLMLPEYGSLAEIDEASVLGAIDQLLVRGTFVRTGKKYPRLWLAGKPQRQAAVGRSDGHSEDGAAPGRTAGGSRSRSSKRPSVRNTALAKALDGYRRREAKRLSWKTYMVFQKRVIVEIEAQRPQSLEALAEIPGLGPAKVERFGSDILELVRRYPG